MTSAGAFGVMMMMAHGGDVAGLLVAASQQVKIPLAPRETGNVERMPRGARN